MAERPEKVVRRLPYMLYGYGQIAVETVRYLVGVIADAAQLLEQLWVHRLRPARSLDLAIADQPLAKTGYAQTGASGIDGTAQMLIGREPYRDGLAARSSRVCSMPWHPSGLIKVGFGAREPRP